MLKYSRVLMIVPELGLALAPEIDSLYPMGYNVQPIQGRVTRERIFANIRERKFDIIHYAGHSGAAGIRLSDDPAGKQVIMDAAALVQIARSVDAQLVFLNGCSSIQVGQVLVDEHIPYVVCTLDAIDNEMARETAQLFYQALSQTNDIRAAFNTSKPPVKGGYSILTNGVLDVSLAPILARLDDFTVFMTRNDAEHHAIVLSIEGNRVEREKQMTQLLFVFRKTRTWTIAVMLAGMVGVGVIVGLFNMLSR